MIFIDSRVAIISSANLTRKGLSVNYEAGVVIKNQEKVILYCPNPNCYSRKRRYLRHFVSRGAFNMEGLGPKFLTGF